MGNQRLILKGLLAVLLCLWGWGGVLAQIALPPSIEITVSRPADRNQDRNPGDVVNVQGRNIFTVELQVTGASCPSDAQPITSPIDLAIVLDASTDMALTLADGQSRAALIETQLRAFVTDLNMNPRDTNSDQTALIAVGSEVQVLTRSLSPADVPPAEAEFVPELAPGTPTPTPTPVAATPTFQERLQTALVANEGQVNQAIFDLSFGQDGATLLGGLQAARAVLDGGIRTQASSAILVIAARPQAIDPAFTEELNTIARQTRAKIYVIDLSGAVAPAFAGSNAQVIAFQAITGLELQTALTQVNQAIQPVQVANELTLSYTVDAQHYTLRTDTISPSPQSVTNNTVIWPPVSVLNAGAALQPYRFEVEAITPGDFPVGTADVSYFPCANTIKRTDTMTGPIVSLLQPTATPLATARPTATATIPVAVTARPTVTFFGNSSAPVNTGTSSSARSLQGASGMLCIGGWYDAIPWVGLLIALALALWFLWNRLQVLRRSNYHFRDILCFITALLGSLYLVFLTFLFLLPFVDQICTIPESVYFWRLDQNESGIFLTNEFLPENEQPALVNELNDGTCVGCHTVNSTAGLLIGIQNGPPNTSLVGVEFDGTQLPINSGTEAPVYSSLSPDGSQLAFTNTAADLYVMPVRGGTPRRINGATDATFGAFMPTWTADGRQIAYTRAARSNSYLGLMVNAPSDIYLIDVADTLPAQPLITQSESAGLNYYPSFSPNGRWLAYTNHNNPNDDSYGAPDADIWLTDLTTFTARPINVNTPGKSDSWATWNRTGTRLAFNTTQSDDNFDIVIGDVDATTGTISNLTFLSGASEIGVFEHLPAWGPPIERIPLLAALVALLPWLWPLLPLALLMLLCFFWRPAPRPMAEEITNLPEVPPPPIFTARKLDAWGGIPVLWEPQPTLVLGLGRSGWNILAQLKKNLYDAGLGTISNRVHLLSIIAGEQENQREPNFTGLDLANHEVIVWRDSLQTLVDSARTDNSLNSWLDLRFLRNNNASVVNPKVGLQNNRMLGRLALFNNLRGNYAISRVDLWATLQAAAEQVRDGEILNVIIVGDSSDDVSSGALLDLAYAVRRLKQTNKGLATVRIVGHLITEAAIEGGKANNSNTLNASINTAAFIRELARFQLAGGAPFPMRYAQQHPLNAEHSGRLFDEIYLYDGRNEGNRLSNIEPQQGIYPAVADAIATWLDTAAKIGDLATWRNNLLGTSQAQQTKRREMMVAGLGIYQYRLPFADLLETITVIYARELLQYLLMADSTERPTMNHTLVKEGFGDENVTDPRRLAEAFLREQLGSSELNQDWRRVFKGILTRNTKDLATTLQRLNIDPDLDDAHWQKWLEQTLLLILNGSNTNDGSPPNLVVKRGAKISLAYRFLYYIGASGEGLLETYAHQLAQEYQDHPAVAQIQRFAGITRDLMAQFDPLVNVLGLTGEATSIHSQLARRDNQNRQRLTNLKDLATRQYILEVYDPRERIFKPLVEVWYEQYLAPYTSRGLSQIEWQVIQGRVLLVVELPRKANEALQQIVLNPESPSTFIEALIELARYFAQDIRNKESLTAILENNLLNSDNFQNTLDQLSRRSAIALRVDTSRLAGSNTQNAIIISASSQITQADQLRGELARRRQITTQQVLRLNTTDPFSLTVIQTADSVTQGSITSLSQAADRYRDDVYDPNNQRPSAIFDAEVNAIAYEQRLGELNQPKRMLNPLVVTALARPAQAKVYLLAAAIASSDLTDTGVRPEWIKDRTGIRFANPEVGNLLLIANADINLVQYCTLLDGLYLFSAQVDDATATKIYERYSLDEALLTVLDVWERSEGDAWAEGFEDCGEVVIPDLIALTRLLIRQLIAGE